MHDRQILFSDILHPQETIVAKRKIIPPWEHVGNPVGWDSPIRCEISYKRPEQVMRCVYAAGHQGAHLYGNLRPATSNPGEKL